jgi:hypothetical protein
MIPTDSKRARFDERSIDRSLCALLLAAAMSLSGLPATATWAADKEAKHEAGKTVGILIEKSADWLSVKADGEDEPVKYLVGSADAKLVETLKSIFNASRVQLTYQPAGDARQLLSIKKQVLKKSGTVTGAVVKVYNDFWVEVKPKNGQADAYAPGANYNDKEFMARLKALQPGEVVTIKFYTDFERHRIETLRKHEDGGSSKGKK